ncbi:uncharacterized protein C630.12-like isoform X2 [Stegodyphus dumicola]|uniref:uncharacterized protein C630.12-like isoform X2 n=1 Tax=Stegodyphus dumicola TaxID=202533 RepID=UPI0015B162DB|nr:uncharacterized protein C630.12-like isoform X2 [Stegodyphus dumicola]
MEMNNLSKKYRNSLRITVFFMFVLTMFEWFEYSLSPLLIWPKFSKGAGDTVKLLIVGDPQLLGNRYSAPSLLGLVLRWDADRYISKTFSLAYNFVEPDLVIFLGDNLDEGEIANDEEFTTYFKRFRNVFQEVDFDKAVIVPGDNDIGGENEPPLPEIEKRFNKYFRSDVFIKFQFLEFVKVNYITHSNKYMSAPNVSSGSYRIILSHIPLTQFYSTFVSKSQYIISERKTSIPKQMAPVTDFNSFLFNITETTVHEIVVPTCSYRMGTSQMGYGALEINAFGEVSYAVLWLPSRFRQLLIYLIVIILIFLLCLISVLKPCLRLRHYGF